MGRGPVQLREASSHQKVGRQLDAKWSGRICTWPVLTTDTRRIGSVTVISVLLRSASQRPSMARQVELGSPPPVNSRGQPRVGLAQRLSSGCPGGRIRGLSEGVGQGPQGGEA